MLISKSFPRSWVACPLLLMTVCLLIYLYQFTTVKSVDTRHARNSGNYTTSAYSSAERHTTPDGISLPPNMTFFPHHQTQRSQDTVSRKLIVVHNHPPWFFKDGKDYANAFKGCNYNDCSLVGDMNKLSEADAMLVYVCLLNKASPPPRPSRRQVWVAYCPESPVHYVGHYLSLGWKSVFNWTMSYRTDSDVFLPYGSLALRPRPSQLNYTRLSLQKDKPIAWFVGNCQTQSQRMKYVKELQKYIQVDIFGKCARSQCGNSCLSLLNSTYFFYLSFENSMCRDYVTEKLFKTFQLNVIPVVRGGMDYGRYFPPDTFINTADFSSPKHLATHLKFLMANVTTYTNMLALKDRFTVSDYRWFCGLCEKLHTAGTKQKTYPNIVHWANEDQCSEPTDL